MLKIDKRPIERMASAWNRIDRMSPGQLEHEILQHAEPAAKELVESVKRKLRQHGQTEMANHVTWWRTQNNLVVGIPPGSMANRAFEIEFGTQSDAPTPLLRSLVNEEHKRLSAKLTADMHRSLFRVSH